MSYRGFLPPITCPRCGTLNNQVREKCRYCNGPLENYCSDEDCMELNLPQARYCKMCGKPTIFLEERCFDEEFCSSLKQEAKDYYKTNGDPDTPEAKAEVAQRRREYLRMTRRNGGWYDDFPEMPTEPDYIPFY